MLQYSLSLYLFIAVIVAVFLSAYTISKGRGRKLRLLALLSLSIAIYLLGYGFELQQHELEQILFWNMVQFVGIIVYPPLWLMVGLAYTDKDIYVKRWQMIVLWFFPVLALILRITNSYHGWIYASVKLNPMSDITLVNFERGPMFYFHSVYVLMIVVINIYLFYRAYQQEQKNQRFKFKLCLYASILPCLGLLLMFINPGALGFDYAVLLLPWSLSLLGYALVRHDFMEVRSLAREQTFDGSEDALIISNHQLRVTDYNKKAEMIFETFGLDISEVSLKDILKDYDVIFNNPDQSHQERLAFSIDQVRHHYEVTVTALWERKQVKGYLVSLHDITPIITLHRQMKRLAEVDDLSSLHNRRYFMKKSMEWMHICQKENAPYALIMMDLDFFKHINDQFGHAAGDVVIQGVSELLKNTFRKTDVVARMGGEEFSVFMPYATLEEAYKKSEHFRETLEKHIMNVDQNEIHITVSIGIACEVGGYKTIEDLLKNADQALYRAKDEGRNQTVVI